MGLRLPFALRAVRFMYSTFSPGGLVVFGVRAWGCCMTRREEVLGGVNYIPVAFYTNVEVRSDPGLIVFVQRKGVGPFMEITVRNRYPGTCRVLLVRRREVNLTLVVP